MDQAPRRARGRDGRPPHKATARVAELVREYSDHAVVALLEREGISISRRTVARIRRGEQTGRESCSLLNRGERRLDPPEPCPRGCGLLAIAPCRTCGADPGEVGSPQAG